MTNNKETNKKIERPRAGGGRPGSKMGMPAEKVKDFKGTLRRLLKYVGPHKFYLILILFLTVFSTGFSILGPKISGLATTRLSQGVGEIAKGIPGARVDFDYIGRIVMILFGLYLVSAIFSYIQQYIMVGVTQKIIFKLREDVDKKLSKLPLSYYDKYQTGEILSRVTNDVDNISSTLQQSLTQLLSAIVSLVGIIIMMLIISPTMTLITLVTIPLSILATKSIAKKSQEYFIVQSSSMGDLNGHIEEMYTGHQIIKAFGKEEDSIDRFKEINDEMYNSSYKAQFISGIIMPIMNFINNIGYIFVSVVGGLFVIKSRISIGDVQAFIQYSRQFTQPIVQTADIANVIQSTIASAERVFEILDEEEEVEESINPIELKKAQGRISFNNVDFSYNKNEDLIKDLNIKVEEGQKVAIVGPTGAGKTTIVNLLMRFYEIDGGQIEVDGYNILDFRRGDLRKMFGMVLQDTWLFNGTIKENIAYGKENPSDEEIYMAAKHAQADHFISLLPEGYDTILNEDASNISQGQKQLLTIARALLTDPTILILDEATSSVDTRTEILIQKAMNKLMEGRTSFIIAHRLSTIKNADTILVLKDGKIIEQGNHEELLSQNGFYKELYSSQFAA